MKAPIEYLDFDLQVTATPEPGTYRVEVIASPKGEASGTMTFPYSSERLENVILKLSRARSGVRSASSTTRDLARTFGHDLYASAFPDEVGTCFRRSLDAADDEGKGLRVRLRLSNAPQLIDVPWEYLFPAGLDRFLVLSRLTPVVRYLDLPRGLAPLHVDPPLRILLIVSSPDDLPTLDVGAEVRKMHVALKDLESSGSVTIKTLTPPTLNRLRHELRLGTYHVLHFIGHGGFDTYTQEGMLAFEDDYRHAHLVSGTALATPVQAHRTMRLAVLNACEGARESAADPFSGVAQALVKEGLPAVVAMQFEISDRAATTVSQEFYSAIADGYPIDAALAEARAAVSSEGSDVEWGTPVLYMRSRDGQIFDVSETPPPVDPTVVHAAQLPAVGSAATSPRSPSPPAHRDPVEHTPPAGAQSVRGNPPLPLFDTFAPYGPAGHQPGPTPAVGPPPGTAKPTSQPVPLTQWPNPVQQFVGPVSPPPPPPAPPPQVQHRRSSRGGMLLLGMVIGIVLIIVLIAGC